MPARRRSTTGSKPTRAAARFQSTHLFGSFAKHVHHTNGSTQAVILGRTVHLVGASDARAEGRIRGATIALAYATASSALHEDSEVVLADQGQDAELLAQFSRDGRLARGSDRLADGYGMTATHVMGLYPCLNPLARHGGGIAARQASAGLAGRRNSPRSTTGWAGAVTLAERVG
jgi:hypothetical protein